MSFDIADPRFFETGSGRSFAIAGSDEMSLVGVDWFQQAVSKCEKVVAVGLDRVAINGTVVFSVGNVVPALIQYG